MRAGPTTIATLYLAEHKRLRMRFQRKGASAQSASDLVQDTFIRLLRAPVDEIANLRAYLYRAADSVAVDAHRSQSRSAPLLPAAEGEAEQVVDPGPGPEARLISQEELRALEQAMAELPPRCREVLRLHRFEGLSHLEIAARLGISHNTVMVHMVKALALLRERMRGAQRPDGQRPNRRKPGEAESLE